MYKKIFFALALSTASVSSLCAYIAPTAGQWGVQVEFLYLLPTVDDTYYVTSGFPTTPGASSSKRNNDYSFTPGFRVEGSYDFCASGEIIARYARLRSTTSDTTRGFISPVRDRVQRSTAQGVASSDLDLLYQNVDVLYGFPVWNSCKFNLDIHAGLEFAYVRQHENLNYNLANGTFPNLQSIGLSEKTWGIGPQFGFAINWDLYDFTCRCPGKLSIVSRLSTSLLVSETTFEETVNGQNGGSAPTPFVFNVDDDSTWRMVPAVHARVGFNYAACISCVNASFEIGYEFHDYLHAISREIFNNTNASVSNSWSNYNDFSANGLYVALGVAF